MILGVTTISAGHVMTSVRKLAACSFIASVVFLNGTGALAAAGDNESDKERIERLEATVTDLTRRLSSQEEKAAAREQLPPVAQEAPAPQRGPRTPDLEVYGFVQLDTIQDFKRVNPDWDATLRPSRIPTEKGEFGSNGQSIFSVRQSRLGIKASGTLAGKPYEAKFEFDTFGVGVDAGQTTFRLRHAYAKWGP